MRRVHPFARATTPTAETPAARPAGSAVLVPQYRLGGVLAVWAAAALPMAALAWLVAPAVADRLTGPGYVPMVKALLACRLSG